MTSAPKIQPHHRERLAYVYIRQSTPQQVVEHRESQDLQYQLAQRARDLGWPEAQIVVVDDDLGKSAISATDRPGFQSLVAAVGLGRVGLILVTDVSRLARNCSDWFQLLDLASIYASLISDASGIYDPRDYNDRLLLGLKGTFSKAQWYAMRAQLQAARLNKARRAELALRLPIGYHRGADGQVSFTPDRQVQSVIHLVFDQFERLASARAVLAYFNQHGLQLPRRIPDGPDRGQITWVKASYQAIYQILKNPAYAGAYVYGRHRYVRLPGEPQRPVSRPVPMGEWIVLKQEAFPGYITWEQYVRNQARLRENAAGLPWSEAAVRGAPRAGAALLSGLVFCARCGRPLRARYRDKPAYICEAEHQQYDTPRCQRFAAGHIDQAVTGVFLQALQPLHLEAALAAVEQAEARQRQLAEQWQQRLERARYEAELAQRRYRRVDPDHRLVAAELERDWEAKLLHFQHLQQEWRQVQSQTLAPLSETDRQQLRQLAQDVPALWHAPTTTPQDRKRLLRCLIRDISLDSFSQPGFSHIAVRWHTGAITSLSVPRPKPGRHTSATLIERIRSLAQSQPDDQIALTLNQEGRLTFIPLRGTGRPALDAAAGRRRAPQAAYSHCLPLCHRHARPARRWPHLRRPGRPGTGRQPLHDRRLVPPRLADRASTAPGHTRVGAPDPARPATPRWLGLPDPGHDSRGPGHGRAPLSPEQLREEIRAGRLVTYRLLIKNRWRWFVRPPVETVNPQV
jgi:DNA invertase Pin-like site-specific DNA recombinase